MLVYFLLWWLDVDGCVEFFWIFYVVFCWVVGVDVGVDDEGFWWDIFIEEFVVFYVDDWGVGLL